VVISLHKVANKNIIKKHIIERFLEVDIYIYSEVSNFKCFDGENFVSKIIGQSQYLELIFDVKLNILMIKTNSISQHDGFGR